MKKSFSILLVSLLSAFSLTANAGGYHCAGPLLAGCWFTPLHICASSGYRGCYIEADDDDARTSNSSSSTSANADGAGASASSSASGPDWYSADNGGRCKIETGGSWLSLFFNVPNTDSIVHTSGMEYDLATEDGCGWAKRDVRRYCGVRFLNNVACP